MSQIISALSTNGLFKASPFSFTTLNTNTFRSELRNSQNEVMLLIEVPGASGDKFELICLPDEQGKNITIPLTTNEMNCIHLTTKGIKRKDGYGYFILTSPSGANPSSTGARACFIKHTPVVNH